MESFVERIKTMNMPPLKRKDVVTHMLRYLNAELNFRKMMDIDAYALGKISALIQMTEVLYTIAIRSKIPIKKNGHDLIHRQTEMDELKGLMKKFD